MKHTKLNPDDPRLTAFALGELAGDERAAVEWAVQRDPALRAAVAEIRSTAAQLEAVLAAEPFAPPEAETAQAANPHAFTATTSIDTSAAVTSVDYATVGDGAAPRSRRPARLIRFPQSYFIIGGLAAACFALLVMRYRDTFEAKQLAVAAQKSPAKPAAPPTIAVEWTLPSAANAAVKPEEATGEPTPPTPANLPPATSEGTRLVMTPAVVTAPAVNDVSIQVPSVPDPAPSIASATAPSRPSPLTASNTSARIVAAKSPSSVARAAPSAPLPVVDETNRVAATAPTAPVDEIVRLDAFTVTADPVYDFASALKGVRFAETTRGRPEPDELPLPPHGARFSRYADVNAFVPDNGFVSTLRDRTSSFTADIGTASYANVSRAIEHGMRPARDSVRIEELLNHFPYNYPPPTAERGEPAPVAATLEVAEAPWAPAHRLVRVGLRTRDITNAERARANFVFLLDVSTSMHDPKKLPLIAESIRLLTAKLRRDDRVAIIAYGRGSALVLPSTSAGNSTRILAALQRLDDQSRASTESGLQRAYEEARGNFVFGGFNRVILCTDGNFNLGGMSERDMLGLIASEAGSGVTLTILGFGMGTDKDVVLERFAQKGNGGRGYVDSARDARRLLIDGLSTELVTVAKDVKVQVEFNPTKVASYRLIGFENAPLRRDDFNPDKGNASELTAGQTLTALYEIVPTGADNRVVVLSDADVTYQARGAVSSRLEMPTGVRDALDREMLMVRLSYKKSDTLFNWTRTLEFPLIDNGEAFANASPDFQFAAAVAQFGMILRDSPHRGASTLGDVMAWAGHAVAQPLGDAGGYRGEFIDLVRKTQRILR